MARESCIRMRGVWDARHWIRIPGLSHEADVEAIERGLGDLPGIRKVLGYPNRRKIRVTYDQTATNFAAVMERLEEIGFPPASDWWSRKKAKWFDYMDHNARENANAPAPPCCSNPKGLNSSRRK